MAALDPADPDKVAYLMQTTLAADEAEEIVDALRERFPGARGPGSDDICYATTNRQQAVRAIAAESDVVLVVGLGQFVELPASGGDCRAGRSTRIPDR